jgi:hypothetical protein
MTEKTRSSPKPSGIVQITASTFVSKYKVEEHVNCSGLEDGPNTTEIHSSSPTSRPIVPTLVIEKVI